MRGTRVGARVCAVEEKRAERGRDDEEMAAVVGDGPDGINSKAARGRAEERT